MLLSKRALHLLVCLAIVLASLTAILAPGVSLAQTDNPATPNDDEALLSGHHSDIPVTGSWGPTYTETHDCANGWGADRFVLTTTQAKDLTVEVDDCCCPGDFYEIYVNGCFIGATPQVTYWGCTSYHSPPVLLSEGSFTVSLQAGTYIITIRDAGFDGHTAQQIVDEVMCPAGFYVTGTLGNYTGRPWPYAASITSVSPNQGIQGQNLSVTITGTHLSGTSSVSFGSGVNVNSFTIVSATQITGNISITCGATSGARDVSVTTCAGTATLTNGFTVNGIAVVASSNSQVCEGGTISLTGGPGGMPSYSWTGPNFSSNVQNPSIPNATLNMSGTYTLTVTNASGCTATAGTDITVNPLPDSTIITPSVVCAESTGHIASVPDAGPSASYSWTVAGQGILTGVSTQRSVAWNAINQGTATISVTITNAYGCTLSNAIDVSVNAKVVATASSNSPVCGGNTIYLSGPAGMTSYSWTGPNFSSSVQNPSIPDATLAMAGTYILTVTNSSGCTATANTDLVVNAKPAAAASSNSPVCEGSTIYLSGPAGMTSYSWTGPNFSSSVQNPSIPDATLAMAGTYNLTVTSASGCTATASTDVVLNAKPLATASSNSPVCEGNTIYLSGPAGMTSYSWTGPNFSSSVQNPSIPDATLAMAGTYILTVTNSSGCTATANTDLVVNAKPAAAASSNSPVCEGSTIYLSGPAGMTSYSWTGPNFSSSVQNPSIPDATLAMAGTYNLTVTSASGCTATGSTDVVVNAKPLATASSNSPVYEGSTIYLSGPAGMTSYSWTGPNFSSSDRNPSIPNATLDMAGTYILTVTNSSGCTATGSTDVSIKAKPAANADSNSPVCEGSTIYLAGWPNRMLAYSWTGPNFSSNAQNPSIPNATLDMAGPYILTVTYAPIPGCVIMTATTVVVNAKPVPTASSNSPVCEGSTIHLFGGPAGMATYSWTGPNGFTSSDRNPAILNATSAMGGTYVLTVTSTPGCTGTGATTDVMVNAKPTASASSNSPVYETTTISLFGGPDDMSSYSWTGPNGYISNQKSPTISNATLSMAGNYTLTVTDASGCTGITTTNFTVLPIPPPSAPTLLSPGNATYAEGNSITYVWNTSTWATNYWITVSTSGNSSDTSKFKLNKGLGNVTQYTDTGYPNNATTYYWWISAGNGAGWAPQAQVNTNGFRLMNCPPPPSAPPLASPGNSPLVPQGPGNATYVLGTSVAYSWNTSARATMYWITVSTSGNSSDTSKFKLNKGLGNVTQYTDTGYPNNGTTYYWWVSAGNIGGWAPQAQVQDNGLTFTNGLQPPPAPTLVSPGNGTSVPGTSITYSWNASARATMYWITVSTSGNSSDTSKYRLNTGLGNVTQYTDTGYPNNGSTYYWWVSAGNSGGWSPQSEVLANGCSFVNYTPPPPAPTLASPGNGTSVSGTSITYRWNASAGATMYWITVSTSGNSSDMSKVKLNKGLGNVVQYTDTGYTGNGTTYYWWVSAGSSAGGWSLQSQVLANGCTFVNYTPPPSAPTLVSPANASHASSASITYRWNASSGATMYWITASTSSDLSDASKVKLNTGLGNVVQYTDTGYTGNGTTYYWWVSAGSSAGGWSLQSQVLANGRWFINGP